MKKKKNNDYKWTFAPVGGTVRVKISSGEDIVRLGELDRKLWTVLSCPVDGLEFDRKTLELIDGNGDGKIRVDEVIATAKWLTGIVRNPDILLNRQGFLPLSEFNTENPDGAALLASAKQILANLGLEKDSIDLEDTADNVKIFAKTRFNGDGIVTPASAADDEALATLIGQIAAQTGASMDRSGVDGVTADHIEAFYAACAAYAAWRDAAEADKKSIFPYGDKTADALAACEALKAKIADYFMRCKLISFADAKEAVDVSLDKITAISGDDLGARLAEIEGYPLARPDASQELPLDIKAVNPAWQGAFATLKALVLDVACKGKKAITEAEWNEVLAGFGAYSAWMGAKAGAEVEPLGEDVVRAILKADRKADLLALVEQDKALEQEAVSIETVDKLLRLVRNFYDFLNNYVALTDFYDSGRKAVFQAGRLYIDQRSTDLCIRVADMGRQGDVSALSGMYILYCNCVSKVLGKTMTIAAVLTDGDVDDIRVGRNAVFYDRDGNDWDATVVQILDNPISLRQAFWAPYKKVARWISDKIDSMAAKKNDKAMGDLTNAADTATGAEGEKPAPAAAITSSFDIAKFAGIFAAIGMALGFLGQFFVSVIGGVASLNFWQLLAVIAGIMAVISGPSVFIAWRKIKKRNLGPVLNANGWAINARALVNSSFGKTLTTLAELPKLTSVDPKERAKRRRRRLCRWCCLILILALVFGILWYKNKLGCIGLARYEEPVVEQVEEPAEPQVSDSVISSDAEGGVEKSAAEPEAEPESAPEE